MSDKISALPHPDAVTNNQVHGLLQIVGTVTGALSTQQHTAAGGTEPTLPPGARAKLEGTLIAACERLDQIIIDSRRWNLAFQKQLEDKADSLFKQQEQFFDAQLAAATEVSTPHFKYRPHLQKMADGNWMSFLGDPINYPNDSIWAVGSTPEKAHLAFDEIFKGTIPPHMLIWLAQREAMQNDTQNEQHQVDPGTVSKTRSLKKGRKNK